MPAAERAHSLPEGGVAEQLPGGLNNGSGPRNGNNGGAAAGGGDGGGAAGEAWRLHIGGSAIITMADGAASVRAQLCRLLLSLARRYSRRCSDACHQLLWLRAQAENTATGDAPQVLQQPYIGHGWLGASLEQLPKFPRPPSVMTHTPFSATTTPQPTTVTPPPNSSTPGPLSSQGTSSAPATPGSEGDKEGFWASLQGEHRGPPAYAAAAVPAVDLCETVTATTSSSCTPTSAFTTTGSASNTPADDLTHPREGVGFGVETDQLGVQRTKSSGLILSEEIVTHG